MATPSSENRIDDLLVMILAPLYRALAPTRLAFARYPALRFVFPPWQLLYVIGTLLFIMTLVRSADGEMANLPENGNPAYPALRAISSGFVLIGAIVTGCIVPTEY